MNEQNTTDFTAPASEIRIELAPEMIAAIGRRTKILALRLQISEANARHDFVAATALLEQIQELEKLSESTKSRIIA